jgi:hypothetical protein
VGHKEAKRIRKILRREVANNMGEFFKMVEDCTLPERLSLAARVIFKRLKPKRLHIDVERKDYHAANGKWLRG